MVIGTNSYTYQDFYASVQRILFHLHQLPRPTGTWCVGVYTQESVYTYAALLACLGAGATYVPLNADFPVQRNVQMAEDSGLTHLLVADADEKVAALAQALPAVQTINTTTLPVAHTPSVITPHPTDYAYLLFTSGSTGRPKGVPITHANLNSFLTTVLDPERYTLSEEDRFLQMFALTFDLSVYSYLVPLLIGACCCVVPKEGISYFNIMQTLEEQEVTVALMVPSALAYLQPYFNEIQLPALRYSLFCGEALPAALAEGWARCAPHASIENVYGPTEATIFCSRYVCHEDTTADSLHGVVPIGKAMAGVDLLLIDETDASHPTEGELCIGGAQVTPGYWQNPERNAVAFVTLSGTRYYRTGDLCRKNETGDFLYIGRADFQVKIDGYRVELGEIEHQARQLSGAAQLAVVAVLTQQGTYALHLCLENVKLDTDNLLTKLRSVLPAYMVPVQVHVLPQLPLNSNGKIDRKALLAQCASS